MIFERAPAPLMGRVGSLTMSLCWAGIPLGGVVGGALVTAVGRRSALLVCGTAYLCATLLPAVRAEWREIDHRPSSASHPGHVAAGR